MRRTNALFFRESYLGAIMLQSVGVAIASLIEGWLGSLLGPRSSHSVLAGMTEAGLLTLALFALLGVAAHAIAATLMRSQGKKAVSEAAPSAARPHVVRAVGKPVYVLIWVVAGYFMAATVLLGLGANTWASSFAEGLDELVDVGVFIVILWVCFRLTAVLETHFALWAQHSRHPVENLLLPLLARSLRVLLPIVAIIFARPLLGLPSRYDELLSKGTSILLIVAIAFIGFQAVRALERGLLLRFDIHAADNLRARKVYTQVQVIGRVIDAVIGLFALASVLMLFSEVRHVGTSLLASAGIVGIIAGVAAQKPLANVLAGFQIALAQPIRVDDVVIVEGEWGRVEEITLTYVVVHIWDDRRLVLPLGYFIEKPFQNWTRTSSQLLGSVFVWVDYTFPVDEGRVALKTIIEGSRLWDRRFWNLQVSDADAKSMQLRVLATTANSSDSWDLRCEIREKLVAFIRERHPRSLPKLRAEVDGGSPAGRSSERGA
jgi:small-conductance mechanosensitive channel